jgi:IS30 family transposase
MGIGSSKTSYNNSGCPCTSTDGSILVAYDKDKTGKHSKNVDCRYSNGKWANDLSISTRKSQLMTVTHNDSSVKVYCDNTVQAKATTNTES